MPQIYDAIYMAHGFCLLWQPWLVALHVISDVLICIAYTAIPIAILLFLRKRQFTNPKFNALGYLFASFIFLCGLTHAIQILTMWYPWYHFQGLFKAITGVVSIVTAIIIFPLIRQAVRIPTLSEYETLLEKLEKKSDELEAKVMQRTKENEHLMREAEHRTKNILSIVQSMVTMSAQKKSIGTKLFLEELQGRLQCLSMCYDMLTQNKWESTCMLTLIQKQLQPFNILPNMRIEGPDIRLSPNHTQYLSLALYELATNSTKFELKTGVGARYSLSWKINNDTLKLVWTEQNSRNIDKPTREGFGMRLLTKIVPAAFQDGKADLVFGTHSINYILEAKL